MPQAVITTILSIDPISNADAIERVRVLGWQLVAKKGEFQVGDKCIYIEIDSVVPERPEFEFLRSREFCVKTVRMRGQISQGLALPLSLFPGIPDELGTDVSEYLCVTHYEKPIPFNMRADVKGNFPDFIPKTDEPRIQGYPDVLDELRRCKVIVTTVKLDGTSFTAYVNNEGEFGICSRNNEMKYDGGSIYAQVARKFNLREKMLKCYADHQNKGFAIQCELCGPGIQKNRLGLTEHKLFAFDLWNIDSQSYEAAQYIEKTAQILGIDYVPEVPGLTGYVGDFDLDWSHVTLDQLLQFAAGTYVGTTNRREGIVIRPRWPEHSKALRRRLSVKVLNNEYLLKDEE